MKRDYNTELYNKMKSEQDYYRKWLLSQSPDEILKHTFEYTIREDIVMKMENLELDDCEAKALLKSRCPLADVYKEFCYREYILMEEICDSITTRAKDVMKRDKERSEAR